jgi:putative tryptophan/tyrosine transport system substrate-binding protein
VRRRQFITLLGGAAAAWPLAARTQQAAMPVIGFLHGGAANTFALQVGGFQIGLKDAGFVEGQNLVIEYRWGEEHPARLPAMAADLVRRRVAVIVAAGGTNSIRVAKAATTAIPIVFSTGSDPVRLGLVTSLARPSGNATGVSFFSADLVAKGMGLLTQIAPRARIVALLFNPNIPDSSRQPADAREAARALGLELVVLNASSDADIDQAFATLLQRRAGALVIGADPFFGSRIDRLAELTQRHRIPATYFRREFPDAGGLMSYGTSITDAYRQVGIYSARILKGDKPADLPVMLSTKFEFVVNLKTAKALGLEVPAGVSAMADEVIE